MHERCPRGGHPAGRAADPVEKPDRAGWEAELLVGSQAARRWIKSRRNAQQNERHEHQHGADGSSNE